MLEDDLDTEPTETLAPIVCNDFLAQVEGGADTISAILDPVSAEVSTEVLTAPGVRIAIDQEDVARDLLAGLQRSGDPLASH